MEKNNKAFKKKNGTVIEDSYAKQCLLQWSKNITVIDLSKQNLKDLSNVIFPSQLLKLNVSHNELCDVPKAILNLEFLKVLDISFNCIKCFDDSPHFTHAIEQLDLSNNKLESPPYWVFSESPESLQKLDISNNWTISISLNENYIKDLLQFNTVVTELHAYNCNLNNHVVLLQCFSKMKTLHLGTEDYANISANRLPQIPCVGLDKCCDIEELNLCNTNIFTLTPNICMYNLLNKLDVSQNNLNNLPNEFCELNNLEICILSHNNLFYFPENMWKLEKLKELYVDSNKLCMVFENLHQLANLKILDLYDNNLYELPQVVDSLEKLDFALNYFEEPEDQGYLDKKFKLRCNRIRLDGRKVEVIHSESERSPDTTDDEEFMLSCNTDIKLPETENRPPSSVEDWDSDDYWIPHVYENEKPPYSPWHYFIQQKLAEGHFCPIDSHPLCIADIVRYEKLCNPPIEHESDGQFDDYSDDDT